jgi:hypothetical protein
MGICPHCRERVVSVDVEAITITFGLKTFRGVSFSCANTDCHAVLTVQVDPASQRRDLLQALNRVPHSSLS